MEIPKPSEVPHQGLPVLEMAPTLEFSVNNYYLAFLLQIHIIYVNMVFGNEKYKNEAKCVNTK